MTTVTNVTIMFCKLSKCSCECMRIMSKVSAVVLVLVVTLLTGQAQTSVPTSSRFPNLFAPYVPRHVPEPRVTNTARIDQLMHDGKILLSLRDSIALALENNLDLAISRYNLAIADTDILRAKSGNAVRGVATGLVQGTPGGGIGGFGAGAPGAGAGGTSGGAGGAGTGASGLVQSTLGTGAPIESYDPMLLSSLSLEHSSQPLSNTVTTGVNLFQQNNAVANFNYSQAFATGTRLMVDFNNARATNNSLFSTLVPEIRSDFRLSLRQHLLSGFGLGPNLRFIRIAKNNREISDVAFRNQVVATVVQIQNIYWDLVSAFENVRVNQQSVALAEKTVSDNRAQVRLGALAPIEVTRAASELAQRRQDLLIAETQFQLQQLLIKNAITRNLSDAVIARAPVVPTDTVALPEQEPVTPVEGLIKDAVAHRPELVQTRIDLTNRDISRKAAANALLPTVDLVAWYGGSGLAGVQNPFNPEMPSGTLPTTGLRHAITQLVHTDFPDYAIGLTLNIPVRNRAAEADQVRSELEYRQSQMRSLQLQNQIGIEVRNAQFALQQNRARVDAARQARDLAQQTFDIEGKRFALGASTSNEVLLRQRDLAQAESTLVSAMSAYAKSRVELDRSIGAVLTRYGIVLDEAERGTVRTLPAIPDVQARPIEEMLAR